MEGLQRYRQYLGTGRERPTVRSSTHPRHAQLTTSQRGARDILSAYHHKIGGAPNSAGKSLKKTKSTNPLKRGSTEDSPAPTKRRKQPNPDEVSTWRPQGQDWENQVVKVETIERDTDNEQLLVYVRWVNGKQTKLSMDLVRRHLPRPMLDFYETHL